MTRLVKEVKQGMIGLFVTLVLLFSSFFTYQWFFIQRPIQQLISQDPHTQVETINISPQKVEMQLKVSNASLANYGDLYQSIQEKAGQRQLNIQLMDHSHSDLDQAWNEMAFGVQEGLTQKRYTQIQKTVQDIATKQGIQSEVFLQESFLCITLKKGDYYLYRVFHVNPQKEAKTVDL